MTLYEQLLERKNHGEKLDIKTISREQLRQLFYDEQCSNGMLAELFDVTPSVVSYRRRKFGINFYDEIGKDCIKKSMQAIGMIDREVLNPTEIDRIAKAVTLYAFRNGPVEDLHAGKDSKLTDDDMKMLNKYMVNHIAYLLNLVNQNKWHELEALIETYYPDAEKWDKAVY